MPVSAGLRWESSSLPLFVKTVWTDGHRHVVLREEDPLAKYVASARKPRSRLTSSCSSKSHPTTNISERTSAQNLKIQTVKLLLSGINKTKGEDRTKCQLEHSNSLHDNTVTLNIVPTQHQLKTKNINKEVCFWNNKPLCRKFINYNSRISTKSVRNIPDCDLEMDTLLSSIKYDAIYSGIPDTLSERVMVWLDLAHNGNVSKTALNDHRKRVSTASVYETKQTQASEEKGDENHLTTRHYHDELSMNQTSPTPEDACQRIMHNGDDSILKSSASPRRENSAFVRGKQNGNENVRGASTRQDGKTPLVDLRTSSTKSLKGNHEIFRQQLHIFMPVLPKRNSECASTLSSKSSSLIRHS